MTKIAIFQDQVTKIAALKKFRPKQPRVAHLKHAYTGYTCLRCVSVTFQIVSQLSLRSSLSVASLVVLTHHRRPSTISLSEHRKMIATTISTFLPIPLSVSGPAGACKRSVGLRIGSQIQIWAFKIRHQKWKTNGIGL